MRDWGTYRKLYETVSPSFERLPFAARCLAAELLRRADRVGRVIPVAEGVDESAIADLAFIVRAHDHEIDFIRDNVAVLLRDRYLVLENQWLTIRNFAKAQLSDSALRMRRHRDASDAHASHPSPSRVLPDETRPNEKIPPVGPPGGGTPAPAKRSKARKEPARTLPDDWAPKPKHAETARSRGLTLELEERRFRESARANGRRYVDWDAAFNNWLLSPYAKPASGVPVEPDRPLRASEQAVYERLMGGGRG